MKYNLLVLNRLYFLCSSPKLCSNVTKRRKSIHSCIIVVCNCKMINLYDENSKYTCFSTYEF
jgi:hypothetical protein